MQLFHWKVEAYLPNCSLIAIHGTIEHARSAIIKELHDNPTHRQVDVELCEQKVMGPPDEICYYGTALIITHE